MALVFNPATGQMEEEESTMMPSTFDAVPSFTQGAPPSGRQLAGVLFPPLGMAQMATKQYEAPPVPETPPVAAVAAPDVGQSAPMPAPSMPPMAPPMPSTQTTTTRTREIQSQAEKDALAATQGSLDKEADIVEQQGALKTKQAEAAAVGKERMAAHAEVDRLQMEQAQQRGNDEIERARQKYNDEMARFDRVKDIRDLYDEVDPKTGEVIKDKNGKAKQNTGLKVKNAIAVALGEIGKGLQGGRGSNVALEMLQDINRDHMARERMRIEQGERSLSRTKEGIGAAEKTKQDRLNDMNLRAAARMEAIAKYTEAEGARIGTEHALLESKRLAQGVRTEKNKLALQTAASLREKISSTTEPTAAGRAGGANNDKSIFGDGGQTIYEASTPKHAENANKQIAAYRKMDAALKEYSDLIAKQGKAINPLGQAWSKEKGAKSRLTMAYKTAEELGALTGPDMGIVEDAVTGGYTGDQLVAKLAEARSANQRSIATALDSQGIPGKRILESFNRAPAQGGAGGDKFMNGAKIVWVEDQKTGQKVKAAQMPDGRLIAM